MPTQDKKLAVLHQLSLETKPVNIRELLTKLGKDFPERSVRRWLAEMIQEGLVEKLGQKRGTAYIVLLRSHRHSTKIRGCFGSKSTKAIEYVRLPIYERTPISYENHWLESYQPNITFYIPIHLRSQLHEAGQRTKYQEPAGTYAHQIFHRLIIDLSYNSSRLEGNTYSLLDTQRLVLDGEGAEGKLEEEKIMILNHKEAIRYLVDNAPRLEVLTQTIYTLHYLLSDGLLESRYSGKVRDHAVRIGGSTYLPFEDSEKLKNQLERITKKAAQIDDPYEQSFFLLVHITYIQAFSDVNKRTARLSANIPLIKNNLVPLSFSDVEKDDYTSAVIAIYELQDIHPILDLYVFSYMRTCAMYDATVKAVGFDEIRVRYRQQRRAIIRDIIVHNLIGPMMVDYISTQAATVLTEKLDQPKFIEDVLEDLRDIDESRIAGLGITPDQLRNWINARQKLT